jgi:hypothetical protein
MAARATSKEAPIAQVLSVQDEKIGKVVDEVDRFFRSIRADVEDWKFAMEDDGDGTRIFVRFQIHINPSADRTKLHRSPVPGAISETSAERAVAAPSIGGSPPLERRSEIVEPNDSEDLEAAIRSDPDLASFVREWKRKQESSPRVEFHKPGAPLLEAQPSQQRQKVRHAAAPKN